jgi:hypothetical protein
MATIYLKTEKQPTPETSWDLMFSQRQVWRWLIVFWVVAPSSLVEDYWLHGATTQKTIIFIPKRRLYQIYLKQLPIPNFDTMNQSLSPDYGRIKSALC